MIDGAKGFAYTALNREANRFGNAIRSLGIKKGDRVAFIAKDCKEFVFVYLGLAKIGAVMVPLNYRCVTRELEYMLRDCEASVLVFQREYSS